MKYKDQLELPDVMNLLLLNSHNPELMDSFFNEESPCPKDSKYDASKVNIYPALVIYKYIKENNIDAANKIIHILAKKYSYLPSVKLIRDWGIPEIAEFIDKHYGGADVYLASDNSSSRTFMLSVLIEHKNIQKEVDEHTNSTEPNVENDVQLSGDDLPEDM